MLNVRDMDINKEVERLYRLKYFSSEFQYYATMYLYKNRMYYRFNQNAEGIYYFIDNGFVKNICATPVEKIVRVEKVPSGKEFEVSKKILKESIQSLNHKYPLKFLQEMCKLNEYSADNLALEPLMSWKQELIACFDKMQIDLFRNAVWLSYTAKHLSKYTYHFFENWLNERYHQIEPFEIIAGHKQRTFYGFFYQNRSPIYEWRCFVDANQIATLQKKHDFEKQGLFCTPIISEVYSLQEETGAYIRAAEAQFREKLTTYMTELYLERLINLRNLIAPNMQNDILNMIEQFQTLKESFRSCYEMLLRYSVLWGAI